MTCRRCPKCEVNWPCGVVRLPKGDAANFERCPECRKPTVTLLGQPIDIDEARSRYLHAEFARYCEQQDHDAARRLVESAETA